MCAALCKPQNAAMLSKLAKPLLPGIGTRLASGQGSSKHYDKLMNDTKFYRNKVVNHPLFSQIHDLPQLRIFMQDHVFAVYDFMSLLKNLQGRFTNLNPLWTPPSNRIAARLINEIVLGEECDEINKEKFVSHYELYTQAMEQVNADIKPVLALSNSLEMHRNPTKALEAAKKAGATDQAIQFVKDTWEVSVNPNKSEVEVAAYFLFGREDPIPDMFRSIMKQVPELYLKDDFVTYLERHIHLDEEEHGPMARRLLESLCKHDEKAWQVCTDTAAAALESRAKLWDGTLKTIKS